MAECDAVLEIRDSNRVRPEKRIIIITRMLLLQATVKDSNLTYTLTLKVNKC